MNTSNVYNTPLGSNLVDPSFFPTPIQKFVELEGALYKKLFLEISGVVEIGCMTGRYLRCALESDISYLGIDVIPSYIDSGRQTLRDLGLSAPRFSFVVGDADNLYSILADRLTYRDFLIIFPFNSFGNISNVTGVIDQLCQLNQPFLISSYSTSAQANSARSEYYTASGIEDVSCQISSVGVYFSSPNGFGSMAFESAWLDEEFSQRSVTLHHHKSGEIGLIHTNSKLELEQAF